MIVGLDLSLTAAGVAVLTESGECFTETFGYQIKKPTAHDQLLRNISITRNIIQFLKKYEVRFIAVENYGFAGHTLGKQAELGGLVKAQVYLNFKRVVVPIPPTAIRAFLLPKKGKAKEDRQKIVSSKKPVEAHIRSLGYNNPKNDNEFDALAVALVMKTYTERDERALNKQQRDLLKRIDEQMVKD